MIQKIVALAKRHWDLLIYIFFGGLTTVVSFAVYLPLYNWFGCSGTFSNCVSWIAAVAFAYVTNKPFVFHSHDWSWGTVGPELAKFVSCRIGSGAVETLTILITVDWLGWDGNLMKVLVSILVVVLNYVASKWLVFRK